MNDEHTTHDTLAARLKEAREYCGFSQEEVAHHLSVPRTAISHIENGSRRVSALELPRLAKLYQTSMESLTGQDQEGPEPESVRMVARAAADLSETDRAEVLRFVQFLRSRQPE
ncbi:MAG: helix-turn-helix transcriptional regulator [Bryobacterales bacterium]|nr:helix-turn-helix transcriptional regulator [Bryobacterales bacterium]